MVSLDAGEALQLVVADADFATETDSARCTTDEANTVRVERLVDRSCPRLSAGDGNTTLGLLLQFRTDLPLVTLAQVFDNSRLHGEFDPVQRNEPYDIL